MITLVPNAGLCNRMRAIDSAIALSQELDRKLRVFWVKDAGLNCGFHDLFKPPPSSVAIIKDVNRKPFLFYDPKNLQQKAIPFLLRKLQTSYFDKTIFVDEFSALFEKKFDFKELKNYRRILIESHSRFFHSENEQMYKHFKPLPEIENKIQENTRQFSQHTIGVHIRRTDNKKSIDHSPFELFVHVMKKEIDLNSSTNFFVASDSEVVKSDLINIFGDRILLSTQNEGKRSSKPGMIDAVVDLYTLSRTKKILGSYWSSYSHTASHISGIEEIVVKKGLLPSIYEV